MASPAGGLVQRRKGGGGGGGGGFGDETDEDRYDTSNALNRRGSDLTGSGGRNSLTNNNQDPLNHSSNHGIEQDNDGEDKDGGGGKGRKQNRLTLLDEVFLLGLKDAQGYLSFWNDNISYVLRGCILMELSLRNKISVVKEVRKRPFPDRLVEVVDDRSTGEVLLDEALRLIRADQQSVASWIDLLSGETWNLMKVGYQLKQVRERIAKGLVDKGVLRTEKRNFVLFDMATHPVANQAIKDQLVQRVIDTLLGRGPAPDKRMVALVCAAYAANVLENALVGLSHSQRDACFAKVDEFLLEHSNLGDRAKNMGTTEIMAGVLVVYTKMDSIL